jgi:DNA polymerase-3 subunit delta
LLPEAFERALEGALRERVVLVAGREALCAEAARDALSQGPFDESRVAAGPRQLREAIDLCETPSFFDAPRLVVAWGVEALSASARATKEKEAELGALERFLQAPPAEGLLLLWAPEADRRLRAVRMLQERGALLDAAPPGEREYGAWVRHLAAREGIALTPGSLRAYEESGLDLLSLQAALRVAALAAEGAPLPEEIARWAAPPGGDLKVFALTDALLSRDPAGLSSAVPRLLAQGESPIGLVALAARQLRLLARGLGLKAGNVPQTQWQQELGVHPFVARKIADALRLWPLEDLHRAFRELLACDLRLKSGGAAEPTLLLSLIGAVRR